MLFFHAQNSRVEKINDKMNEPNQEPLNHEKTNEPNQEPLDHEKTNEPNQESLDHEKTNESNQESLDHEKTDEPYIEPMDNDKKYEPNQEPFDQDKKNELNKESLAHDKKNEPDQESLDQDKSADQLGSSPNFVKKMQNFVKKVANYLQSNGSRFFIWGRTEIDPENNADANTGESQHSTNGPNAKDEPPEFWTRIHITKKQIDNKLQCTVCLDEYELGEEALKLNCGHIFHDICIFNWVIRNETCPVCRIHFIYNEFYLPKTQVSLFRSIVRRVCRAISSPLFYIFPSLRYAPTMRYRRQVAEMNRYINEEQDTPPQEPPEGASPEEIKNYIFSQYMFFLETASSELYRDAPDAIFANMRRRFSHLHREAIANPAAAGDNPPLQPPEFQAGAENPLVELPEFQAGAENPLAEMPELDFPIDLVDIMEQYFGLY